MQTTDDISIFSSDYWANADGVAARLRAEGPAHRATLPNGVPVWVITGDEQARTALIDPDLSKDSALVSATISAALAEAGHTASVSGMFAPSMLFADPPDHTRLRRLLQRDFTARRIHELQPRIEEVTTQLLDALPAVGETDLIESLAFPLPVTVICELLGVPATDRAPFRAWTAALMEDDPATVHSASGQMATYFQRLIAVKRATPGGDLLSALISAADTGDGLGEYELIGTTFLLFVAGHETTTNLIGNAIRWLLDDPTAWRDLHTDPTLVPAAVEEILRHDSPVRMATHRVTTSDLEVDGIVIPAGSIVLISLGAANRDPRRHGDQADVMDIRRIQQGHLSFGHGIHHCLGAPLARLEATVAMRQLTRRFPDARLARSTEELRQRRSVIIKGIDELLVELRPVLDC